jgi:hypothetical protein
MGYMRHHAIIVTDNKESVELAHKIASTIFPYVSPITPEVVNGYCSFFIPPDGSKEGWEESETGNNQRDDFVRQIAIPELEHLTWVEVQFYDDNDDNRITRKG